MKFLPIIFLAGMLPFSTGAIAEEEIPEFNKADIDGNKFVDTEEFNKVKAMADVQKDLAEFDENKDGKLSEDEYTVLLEAECE
ncbi:MAG: hypothetical protein HOM14_13610 [Gammaproteobacteria bacterium]|jgi:Ca2+-binding EF-hand superfamily protein|nr:hypothetical protein [Gammaproteobacteria bacterium]MBT4451796.1 hypothetical protein [Gammaproteobacteria bacterium]MBT4861875.1 hypothetical protein [Gammaproteobacteria bacterium]MBT6552381.1 hypothetical protein [Gammaproteobacteria bacterium]MBT6700796.1 hypothetical protein [Gammaproteobacteria bacterium]